MKKSRTGVHTLLLLFLSSSWGCVPQDNLAGDHALDISRQAIAVVESPREDFAEIEAQDATPPDFADEQDLMAGDTFTPPESRETLEEEVEGFGQLGQLDENAPDTLTPSGFPVAMNRQVAFFLDFFQNKYHKQFARWLARGARYVPKMKEEFRKAKLPEELAYLPMIESGFSLTALSPASAAGPWQFMQGTAQRYGLTVNSYLDERLHPWRSTKAAVEHLGDLYEEFGSWHLAVAAYNAGSGKMQNAVKAAGTANFWEIVGTGHIENETKMFVPKLIAVILIAENPDQYGFTDVEPEQATATDTVTVPGWTSLKAVAVASDTSFETLRALNTELVAGVTPPGRSYGVRVPKGRQDLVARNLPKVKAFVSTEYKEHLVAKNDSLASICKKYDLTATVLLKANNLRTAKLQPGTRLRVPFQSTAYRLVTEGKDLQVAVASTAKKQIAKTVPIKASPEAGKPVALVAGKRKVQVAKAPPPAPTGRQQVAKKAATEEYYEVQGGDTLYGIARKFNTTADELKYLNNLASDAISPGLRLKIQRGV